MAAATAELKPALNDDGSADPTAISLEPPPEEDGGLFIQCDSCEVWQHGGCVGIMKIAMSPDKYYCELCRKDLHQLNLEPNGYVLGAQLPS